MIAVRVRDDDVLDGRRIEAQLFQTADDLLFRVVGEERVEDDDSLAGGERPGVVNLRADEVEVVEDFRRFDVPGFAGGRGPGAASRTVSGNRAGATHRRARVPVKSNAAAFLAFTRCASMAASIASRVLCAKAVTADKLKIRTRAGTFIGFSQTQSLCDSVRRFEPAPHLRPGNYARLLKHRMALSQHHEIRDRLDAELRRQSRVRLGIDFQNQGPARRLARQFLDLGRGDAAGSAPRSPEIDQDGHARIPHDFGKRSFVHFQRLALRRKLVFANAAATRVGQVAGGDAVAFAAVRAGANEGITHLVLRGGRPVVPGRRFDCGLCRSAAPGADLIRSTVHVRTTFGCCPLSIGASRFHVIAVEHMRENTQTRLGSFAISSRFRSAGIHKSVYFLKFEAWHSTCRLVQPVR